VGHLNQFTKHLMTSQDIPDAKVVITIIESESLKTLLFNIILDRVTGRLPCLQDHTMPVQPFLSVPVGLKFSSDLVLSLVIHDIGSARFS
jgi:hypothetical protein